MISLWGAREGMCDSRVCSKSRIDKDVDVPGRKLKETDLHTLLHRCSLLLHILAVHLDFFFFFDKMSERVTYRAQGGLLCCFLVCVLSSFTFYFSFPFGVLLYITCVLELCFTYQKKTKKKMLLNCGPP